MQTLHMKVGDERCGRQDHARRGRRAARKRDDFNASLNSPHNTTSHSLRHFDTVIYHKASYMRDRA